MNIRRPDLRPAFLVLAAALFLAGGMAACSSDDSGSASESTASAEPTLTDVWARAATNLTAQDMSAMYMTIDGGGEANALVKASVPSDIATTVELHETSVAEDSGDGAASSGSSTTMGMSGETDPTASTTMGMGDDDQSAMMQMRPVDKIEIPADGQVELKPGGYHIMLIDLQRELQVGDTVEVTLTFERGDPITTLAKVRES